MFQFLSKKPDQVHGESGGAREPVQALRSQIPNVRRLLSEQAKVGIHRL
jgi:hypothetical protein